MGPRLRRIGGEAVKFSAVNVVATVAAILIFNALVHGVWLFDGPLHDWPLTSWFMANCVGMAISFFGSRHYAFRHRKPQGVGGGALNYVVINLASFVIPMGLLWLTRHVLSQDSALIDNLSGNVVGGALGGLFRFWAFRRFVFTRDKPRITRLDEDPALLGTGADPEVGPDETELVEHESK